MNYNDQILENKPFNFFKQLMYNLALAICVMLVGVLVLVYGFKFALYEVLSDSQAPEFVKGDMVIVKPQDDYKVGDIIKFTHVKDFNVTHRLIAIIEENGTDYYICHGDNVQSVNPANATDTAPWREDSDYIYDLVEQGYTYSQIVDGSNHLVQNIQSVTKNQIEGEVVAHIDNYGILFRFIKDHYLLIIALVAGIWCISNTVQNEIDFKKTRRLL